MPNEKKVFLDLRDFNSDISLCVDCDLIQDKLKETHEILEAEFQFSSKLGKIESSHIKWGFNFPIESISNPSKSQSVFDFAIVRWFDGKFSSQKFVLFPVMGTQNGNRGGENCVGSGGRSLSKKYDVFDEYFEDSILKNLINTQLWRGFVTIIFGWDGEKLFPKNYICGIPWWGFYGICELINGDVIDWLTCPTNKLWESWFLTNLVSIFPYPFPCEIDFIDPINAEVQKHFWYRLIKNNRRWRVDGIVGVASGWGKTLHSIGKLINKTCSTINVKHVQFRDDVAEEILNKYIYFESISF